MGSLVWAETRKVLKTPAATVGLGFLALMVAWVYWQTQRNVEVTAIWDSSLLLPAFSSTYTLAALATMGPLVAAVVGAVSAGMEFGYGTWPALLTHGASRGHIWLAKVVSILATIAGYCLVSLLVGYASSLAASGEVGMPSMDRMVVAQLATVLFNLSFWACVGFTAALLFRGNAGGIVCGLGFPFLEMFLETLPGVRDWLPVWNQRALAVAVFGHQPLGMVSFFPEMPYPAPGHALVTLLSLAAMIGGASYLLMRRNALA